MKVLPHLLASAVLLAVMPAAMAASKVDLTVTGTLVPAACTPSLGMNEFNHGKISQSDLNPDRPTTFADRKVVTSLNINCTAPTIYGIRSIDNRADTVGNNWYMAPYGLGLTPSGEKLGAHYLEIFPPESTIDGKATFIAVSENGGATWGSATPGDRGIRNHGPLLGLQDTAGPMAQPLAIKDATLKLHSYVVIAPANGLTLNSEIPLDGAATIELVYL